MFIKANDGAYVNVDSIVSFNVYSTPCGIKDIVYRIRAYTFNLKHYEFKEDFATKEAAVDSMVKMVAQLNAGMLNAGMPNPKPQPKRPEVTCKTLIRALRGNTDDFESSGDLDYLREIVTYANAYLEGQHD